MNMITGMNIITDTLTTMTTTVMVKTVIFITAPALRERMFPG